MARILVVAGEPSGDRTLAAVVRALGRPAIGIGGDALEREGVELVAHVRDLSAMGVVEVVRSAPLVARALARVLAVDDVAVAILASWSTANGRLAPLLRRRGIRVVWISPPEIWAWRASRGPRLARAVDRMIVTLPFEEALWRAQGADAHYVGHPVLDVPRVALPRRGLAILPGSRRGEIERLLAPMIAAAPGADIVVAPSLSKDLREMLQRSGHPIVDAVEGAAPIVARYEAVLVASGTASLEAVAMGTPVVVAYAMHPATHAVARRLVRTKSISLPNVVLERAGRRAIFAECVQDEATAGRLAAALETARRDPAQRQACEDVRTLLGAGPFVTRAASLVDELCPADGRARSGR